MIGPKEARWAVLLSVVGEQRRHQVRLVRGIGAPGTKTEAEPINFGS